MFRRLDVSGPGCCGLCAGGLSERRSFHQCRGVLLRQCSRQHLSWRPSAGIAPLKKKPTTGGKQPSGTRSSVCLTANVEYPRFRFCGPGPNTDCSRWRTVAALVRILRVDYGLRSTLISCSGLPYLTGKDKCLDGDSVLWVTERIQLGNGRPAG